MNARYGARSSVRYWMFDVQCSMFVLSLRRLTGTLPLVLRGDVAVRLDVFPVALVPPVENLRRNEDGGEGGSHDADEKGKRNVAQYAAAEHEHRKGGGDGSRAR